MHVSEVLSKELAKYHELGLTNYLIQRCRLLSKVLEDWVYDCIVEQALSRTVFRFVVERYPDTVRMYKWPHLSRSFSRKDRLWCMISHYRFIDRHFLPDFMISSMKGEIILWEKEKEAMRYGISLAYPAESWNEGHLSLIYKINGVPVYTVSFAIIPGKIVKMPCAQVLFISRIQGGLDYDLIRHSIKDFSGIRPASALLAAARAIAAASGITCIAGIRTKHQIALSNKMDFVRRVFNYDLFWKEIGAQQSQKSEAFSVPITPCHKPLCDRKREHRKKKMLNYAFETGLIREIQNTFRQKCLKTGNSERCEGAGVKAFSWVSYI